MSDRRRSEGTGAWRIAAALAMVLGLGSGPAQAGDLWSGIEGSGTLRQRMRDGGLGAECPLRHTEVHAELSGLTSRVWVTQTFANPSDETIEAVYTFPLPAEAAVDDYKIHTSNGTIRGELRRREEARQVYEQARSAGYLAALLEQERPNVFTQSVANLPPGEEIRVELSFVAPLAYVDGAFEFAFPTVVGPRFVPGAARVPDAREITPPPLEPGERSGHDLSLSLAIDAGVPIGEIESPLHEIAVSRHGGSQAEVRLRDGAAIPNRDFVLRYRVASLSLASGYLAHRTGSADGYVTFMLVPPERSAIQEVAPRELVFLVDRSGSQAGAPLEKAKATILWMIEHLRPSDVFQVVSFSNRAQFLFGEPQLATRKNLAQAQSYVRSLTANGGTWMAEAVQQICALPPEQGRLRIISLMTDGYIGNDIEVLDLVRNHCGDARWFPFGTGNSVNRFLLDTMAQLGRGEVEYVLLNENEERIAQKFQERIDAPVLTDLSIEAEGLELLETYPRNLRDLWAQRPVVVHARYAKPGRGRLTLRGRRGTQPYATRLEVVLPAAEPRNSAIASTWARARISALLTQDLYGWQTKQFSPEIEAAVVQTALAHRLSTPFTSFVAVDLRMRSEEASRQVRVPIEAPQGTVFAQGGGGNIQEITVTARKREENLQETPVAITAFSAEDLKDADVRHLNDITSTVPNLQFDDAIGTANSARIYIRGVGNGDPISSDDPGVGLYVDGVYLPRAQGGGLLTLADVERVDVLRGPQGTLFGKNTTGGAIHVVTQKPEFDGLAGAMEGRAGNLHRLDARLSLDVPIVEERAYSRLSFATATRDGVAHNRAAGRDLDDDKLLAGRAQLRLLASDTLEIELSADRSLERQAPRGGKCTLLETDPARAPSALGFTSGVDLPLAQQNGAQTSRFLEACREDEQRGARSVASSLAFLRDRLETTGARAALLLDLGDALSVRSITSWRRYQSETRLDLDATALSLLESTLDAGGDELDALAQELQLIGTAWDDRLDYVVGLFGYKETTDARSYGGSATRTPLRLSEDASIELFGIGRMPFQTAFSDPAQAGLRAELLGTAVTLDPRATDGPFPGQRLLTQADLDSALASGASIPPVFLPGAIALSRLASDELSYAAYTQLKYAVTDSLAATLGLRFTHERRRLAREIRALTPGLIGLDVRRAGELDFGFERSARFDAWTPLVNLSYRASDEVLVYASYSRGFQGGRFNAQASAPELTGPLGSERVTLYQLGIKSSWLDRALVLNAVLFYGLDDDLQLLLPRGAPGELELRPQSADVSMRGAELEVSASVWRALLLNANLSVLDAHYTSFRDPDDARARERRPIATPPYSLTVAATWLEDLGSAGELSLRTEWTHESATATDVLDTRRLRQSKHGELAATLTWSLADGRTQLVVFGRNLLDRTYVSDSLGFRDSFGHGIRYFSEPRSYGLEIRRSF